MLRLFLHSCVSIRQTKPRITKQFQEELSFCFPSIIRHYMHEINSDSRVLVLCLTASRFLETCSSTSLSSVVAGFQPVGLNTLATTKTVEVLLCSRDICEATAVVLFLHRIELVKYLEANNLKVTGKSTSVSAKSPTVPPNASQKQIEELKATIAAQDQTISSLQAQFGSLRATNETHLTSLTKAHVAEVASLKTHARILEEQLAQRPSLHHGKY